MDKHNKIPKLKPKFTDYLMIVATRFLPITGKLRRKIRYKLLKSKEDIVLYESKSYIVLQVPLAFGLGELAYAALAVLFQLYLLDVNGINMMISLLMEYACFLVAMPIIGLVFYPFTAFRVRIEEV